MIAGPSGPAPPCCPVAKSAGDGPPPGHAGPFRGVQPLPCFRSLRSLPCPAGIIRGVFRACERFFIIAHAFPYPRPRKRPVGPFTGRGGIPQLSLPPAVPRAALRLHRRWTSSRLKAATVGPYGPSCQLGGRRPEGWPGTFSTPLAGSVIHCLRLLFFLVNFVP